MVRCHLEHGPGSTTLFALDIVMVGFKGWLWVRSFLLIGSLPLILSDMECVMVMGFGLGKTVAVVWVYLTIVCYRNVVSRQIKDDNPGWIHSFVGMVSNYFRWHETQLVVHCWSHSPLIFFCGKIYVHCSEVQPLSICPSWIQSGIVHWNCSPSIHP